MTNPAKDKRKDPSSESFITDREAKAQKIDFSEKSSKLIVDTATPPIHQLDDTMNDIVLDADIVERLPAYKFTINQHVASQFQNPVALKAEIIRAKPVLNFKLIKFIDIKNNLITIVTDDKTTHEQLSSTWTPCSFINGIRHKPPNQKKTYKIVIKGVHTDIDLDSVAEELKTQGIFNPERILRRSDKTPTTIVKATTNDFKSYELAIKNKIIISSVRHKCEPAQTIIQCYNCQKVGHTHWKCTNTVACNKCGNSHRQRDCSSEKVQCANCGKEHFASARTCLYLKTESNKVINNNLSPVNNINVANKTFNTFQNQNSSNGSYAHVVRGESICQVEITKMIDTKLTKLLSSIVSVITNTFKELENHTPSANAPLTNQQSDSSVKSNSSRKSNVSKNIIPVTTSKTASAKTSSNELLLKILNGIQAEFNNEIEILNNA